MDMLVMAAVAGIVVAQAIIAFTLVFANHLRRWSARQPEDFE